MTRIRGLVNFVKRTKRLELCSQLADPFSRSGDEDVAGKPEAGREGGGRSGPDPILALRPLSTN